MNAYKFEIEIKPLLEGCAFEYSCFYNGEFGDVERIEIDGRKKLGTVEFWSKGWVGVDVYDCMLETQVLNVLVGPEEAGSLEFVFKRFVEIWGAAIRDESHNK